MKITKKNILLSVGLSLTGVAIFSCSKDFLTREPIGQFDNTTLANKQGVESLLIGAYSMLDGSGINDWLISAEYTSIWNAFGGSVGTDDAHKGGSNSNQVERAQIESKTYTSNNQVFSNRWRWIYSAIARANETIRVLAMVTDGSISDQEKTTITAEARFLRGIYHLEAAKMWNNIPYVDETITVSANNYKVKNSTDPNSPTGWSGIEADFQFAIDNLAPTNAQFGRGTSWAAKAFLAKTYMQQAKLEEAKPLLDDIITNGVNVKGQKFDLEAQYHQVWEEAFENGVESVFAVQMSVNEGVDAKGKNGNEGVATNYPPFYGGGVAGWGHQPSFSLANAFKTEDGLPMLDTYNDVNMKNNYGIDQTLPFVPYAGTVDPRLDWTIGRRNIPYHDWGLVTQAPDINGGPYWGKKWVTFKSHTNKEQVDGWRMFSGINYTIIRFADVLLWAAECEVEIGDLNKAMGYVNRIRTRAANPAGFLKTYVNNNDPSQGFTNTPAANYDVETYTSFPSKEFARKAVRFERRIEFATEGHRFFDLQRFDRINKKYGVGEGYMTEIMNAYFEKEREHYAETGNTYPVIDDAVFIKGKHEVYAIPQNEIDQSREVRDGPVTLTQNPGFE